MTDFQRCQPAATGSACPVKPAAILDANLGQLERASNRQDLSYATGFAVGAALALEAVGLLSAEACAAATQAAKEAADARRLAWDAAWTDAGLLAPEDGSLAMAMEELRDAVRLAEQTGATAIGCVSIDVLLALLAQRTKESDQ